MNARPDPICSYYATLLHLGRQDIVDKYLPKYLQAYYKEKHFNSAQAAAFREKLMANIEMCRNQL